MFSLIQPSLSDSFEIFSDTGPNEHTVALNKRTVE